MNVPLYIYIDHANSPPTSVQSNEGPTAGDRDLVATNLALVLRVVGGNVYQLQSDGTWLGLDDAVIVTPTEEDEKKVEWHGRKPTE